MTREEEIIDAGIEYTLQNRPMCISGDAFFEKMRELNRNKSFEEGAKWADKSMIEKACEWLCANMTDNTYLGANTFRVLNKAEFIQKFKKEMEDSYE